MSLRIAVGADHAGKDLKGLVAEMLRAIGHHVVDFGVDTQSQSSVDYPDFAAAVAWEVSSGKADVGVLVCGTGIGMQITANKVSNIRAAVVWDELSSKLAKEHNDVNVLCLGARMSNHLRALDFVKIWLETPFGKGRHGNRIQKIRALEQKDK